MSLLEIYSAPRTHYMHPPFTIERFLLLQIRDSGAFFTPGEDPGWVKIQDPDP